jgi:catechol 2,3-dioxygenase-like lactoylglutathione lyase family enzyme
MSDSNFVVLYVDSVATSKAFYSELLGAEPDQQSPNFVGFELPSGVLLGLWSKHAALPAPATGTGGDEMGFHVAGREAVDALYKEWSGRGVTILQPPTAVDFGYTFTAADPDGHRLRVLAPSN